jgi:hypothetical protein
MSWAIEFYEDEAGERPVEEFFERLPEKHVGKILQVLQMLEEWGPRLPFPYSSQVEGRLRELRVHYGRALYRVPITAMRSGPLCCCTHSKNDLKQSR